MQIPFIYSSCPVTLTKGGIATLTITVSREADFYCERIKAHSTQPCSVLIRDTSDDRQWSNIGIHSSILNSWEPAMPKVVLRGACITLEICDLGTEGNNEVRVSLFGYKDYVIPTQSPAPAPKGWLRRTKERILTFLDIV